MAKDAKALGAEIVAVSVDGVDALRVYQASEAFGFPLLSDTSHAVTRRYGLEKGGFARRATFVLDPEGIVRHVDTRVRVSHHGPDVLEAVRAAQARTPR